MVCPRNQFYCIKIDQVVINCFNEINLKVLNIAIAVATTGLLLSLSGCATVTNGRYQQVDVTTSPEIHANCELKNNKGLWSVRTPQTISVHRSYNALDVYCHKQHWTQSPASEQFGSSTKKMAFGNLIVGGIIGAGVDTANGSAYSYPNKIVVPMERA